MMKFRVFLRMAPITLLLVTQACVSSTAQSSKSGQSTGFSVAGYKAQKPRTDFTGPRFTDNKNGTVTDNSTGLTWLKDANCVDTVGGITKEGGGLTWVNALAWSHALASGACGLTDGSTAGQWRVPVDIEMKNLVNLKDYDNANLMNTLGFTNVQESCYWSYNTNTLLKNVRLPFDWYVFMLPGFKNNCDMSGSYYVWPVRGGQ